jgi:acetolactate synthase-1/2/3 large subunit
MLPDTEAVAMATIDGATLLVRALQRQGISHLFSVSAGGMAAAYAAAQEAGLVVVHTRHEGPAAYMADGWARVTRQVGACLVTHGVGVTNATTGLAAAWMDGSPLLCLALGIPRARADLGNLQELDHLAAVAPVTKYARGVPNAARIPEYVATALRHAWEGQPGPVFLEIPGDVFAETVDPERVAWPERVRPLRSAGDPAAIEAAAALRERAERPVIFAGSGVWWSDAGEALRALAERSGAPVFTRRQGRSTMPAEHELHLGLAWFSMNGVSLEAAARADLVLIVGGHLYYDLEHGRPPYLNAAARLIQIDASPAELGQNRRVEVPIVADARLALEQLTAALPARPALHQARQAWLEHLRAAQAEVDAQLEPFRRDGGSPIHPLRLWTEVGRLLDPRTTIVTGQGDSDFWAELLLPPRAPGRYARSGRAGCLGTELAYAVAARLARPDEPALVTVGDGGFGFSAMELETAVRCRAPIVVIVSNDSAWSMIKAQQAATLGPDNAPFTDLAPVDHAALARSLGCHGERVERPEQIGPALRRALEADRPAVLDVQIRPFTSPLIRWLCRNLPHPLPLYGYPAAAPR